MNNKNILISVLVKDMYSNKSKKGVRPNTDKVVMIKQGKAKNRGKRNWVKTLIGVCHL